MRSTPEPMPILGGHRPSPIPWSRWRSPSGRRPNSASARLAAAAACRETLLEGRVLRAAGLIDQEAAEEAGAGTDPGAERGIAADRSNDRPAAGADGGAG